MGTEDEDPLHVLRDRLQACEQKRSRLQARLQDARQQTTRLKQELDDCLSEARARIHMLTLENEQLQRNPGNPEPGLPG